MASIKAFVAWAWKLDRGMLTSGSVQVFGCRHAQTIPTLGPPASKNLHKLGSIKPTIPHASRDITWHKLIGRRPEFRLFGGELRCFRNLNWPISPSRYLGYTSFLAGVELDHAQDIIADFMDTVVKGLRPTFRLASLRAMPFRLRGSREGRQLDPAGYDRVGLFQVPSAFARRQAGLSICECKACVAMSDLDFKFVVHHGEMVKAEDGRTRRACGTRCDSRHSSSRTR